MQTNLNLPTPTRRRRGAFVAIAIMVGAVGAGSILGITAQADSPSTDTELIAPAATVDIDSLYAAKVADDPHSDTSYLEVLTPERTLSGRVSWYGPGFHGRKTANGERFDSGDLTAAHKSLPFGSLVRVVDDRTGRAVLVRINDRGPYSGGRILDLSEGAARSLGITGRGTCSARLELYPSGSKRNADATPTTFDSDARAVLPHGYTIKLLQTGNYSQASALVKKLRANGDEHIFLSQLFSGSTMTYQVSLGLFSSELACRNLLEELSQDFSSASMMRFDRGTPRTLEVAATDAPAGL